jgi:hypothetical protein
MNARRNPVYLALAHELDRRHIAHVLVPGDHHRLRFSHAGRAHSMVIPSTPSDRRSAANARAYLRRLLRG